MDEGQSKLAEPTRRKREVDRVAVHLERAGIGRVEPGEDLDERRLPAAVFAQQTMNLASVDGEAHVDEGPCAPEVPRDAAQGEGGRHRCRPLLIAACYFSPQSFWYSAAYVSPKPLPFAGGAPASATFVASNTRMGIFGVVVAAPPVSRRRCWSIAP